MVRLTRAGEYAVLGMLYLAEQRTEGLVLIPDIAKAQKVSASFLAKIFQGLTRAGLVESQRGAAGGVSLGRPAEAINIRDIIEAVEGPVALNYCLLPKGRCRNAEVCPMSKVWAEAQLRMLEVLEGATLAELVRPAGGA